MFFSETTLKQTSNMHRDYHNSSFGNSTLDASLLRLTYLLLPIITTLYPFIKVIKIKILSINASSIFTIISFCTWLNFYLVLKIFFTSFFLHKCGIIECFLFFFFSIFKCQLRPQRSHRVWKKKTLLSNVLIFFFF